MRATTSRYRQPGYRQPNSGNTYFFTLVSFRRNPILCLPPLRTALRRAIVDVRATHPFDIDAWVLMPDHLHCILTLPEGDLDHATRWATIRSAVSRAALVSTVSTGTRNPSRIAHRDASIWERRIDAHPIRDEREFERHVDYIHVNPVRHGHAASAADWPYSTFHRYVKNGVYLPEWNGTRQVEAMWIE